MDDYQLVEILAGDAARLEEIGRFRLAVWRQEASVAEDLFPDGKWLEPLDRVARHWIATATGAATPGPSDPPAAALLGAGRLTIHDRLADNPDGYLWLRDGRTVPEPAAHLCKLVVSERARGKGIGRALNVARIEAARAMGARSILVTASDKNARLLMALGFVDTGVRESFANRPGFPFRALELVF